MDAVELEALVSSVTPAQVRELSLRIEARQPAVNRGTAPLWEILSELMIDLPLASAAERSPVEMCLRQAVIQVVSQVDGMTFVEGDG
jgi:hypothetical protein